VSTDDPRQAAGKTPRLSLPRVPTGLTTTTTEREQESQANFRAYVRAEFREHLAVGKKDFATIEHLLRVGRRKLETYSQPGVRNIHC